jgi:hypothetical protein
MKKIILILIVFLSLSSICLAFQGRFHSYVPFSPYYLPGLAVWFAADNINPVTNGAAISSWNDSSPNHLVANQGNTTYQPTYKTNAINGKPVVHFVNQDLAAAGSGLGSSQGTLVAVYSVAGTNVGYVAGIPYSATDTTWAAPYVGFEIGAASGAARYWLNINGIDREFLVAGGIPNGQFKTQSMTFNGTSRNGYLNGVNVYSDSTIPGSVTYSGNPSFMLGMRSATSIGEFLNGDIAEVLYFKVALSLGDLQKVENYLKLKYAHY